MSYIVKIPIEVVNATWPGGYWELYIKYVQFGYAPVAAYEMVESSLSRYGLPGRYSSYYSFRKNQWRMRKELRSWKKVKRHP